MAMALRKRIWGILLVLGLFALWEASARLGWVDSVNWPPFSTVLAATVRGLAGGELERVLAGSLWRTLLGYGIGAALGIVVGILVGSFPLLSRFVSPVAEAIRPLPIPAIVPPLILFLGVEAALKITVVALAVFFPVMVATLGGVRGVDGVLLQTGATFKAGPLTRLWRIVLPAASPAILAGMRMALSLALIITVVAEMIAGSSGIGYAIVTAQYAMRPEEMYAAVLCLMVVGYLANLAFLQVERRILFWYALRS